MTASPNDKHPPRSMAVKNRKYATRSQNGKKLKRIIIDQQGFPHQTNTTFKNEEEMMMMNVK
jgi:hypothetical protein